MKTLIIIIFILTALITKMLHGQTYSNITYDAGTSIEIQTGADVCATTIAINGSFSGGGTICGGALPVSLSSFSSSVEKNNVKLNWTTEWELNNAGFDVERRISGEAERWIVAGFIQGNGTVNEPKNYFLEDKKLKKGTYQYRLKQKDFNSNYEYFSLGNDVLIKAPGNFAISQNYPNPSNPRSKIDYELPVTSKVSVKIYDIIGKEIITLVDETKEAGYYTAEFDGTNLASGVYFYRILFEGEGQKFSKTLKMVLIK